MKKILFFLFLTFFVFNINLQKAHAKNMLRGVLLKSTLKPLPYTEIELVPVKPQSATSDGRITAISAASGKFSFLDVPTGEYTLSINYEEIPTELSPYDSYFFPGTENRSEAKTFHFTGNTNIENISFQLHRQLTQRKLPAR